MNYKKNKKQKQTKQSKIDAVNFIKKQPVKDDMPKKFYFYASDIITPHPNYLGYIVYYVNGRKLIVLPDKTGLPLVK